MPRCDEQIEPVEAAAAVAIRTLAEACQDAAYYHEFQGVPTETRRAVLKCYRVEKSVTEFYFGSEHGLVFDASTTFKKKGSDASIL